MQKDIGGSIFRWRQTVAVSVLLILIGSYLVLAMDGAGTIGLAGIALAACFFALAFFPIVWDFLHLRAGRQALMLAHNSDAAHWITDSRLRIKAGNTAAHRFGGDAQSLVDALGMVYADAAHVLDVLQQDETGDGATSFERITPMGRSRLTLYRIGWGGRYWRLETDYLPEPARVSEGAVPTILFDRKGRLLGANAAARALPEFGETGGALIDQLLAQQGVAQIEGINVIWLPAPAGMQQVALVPSASPASQGGGIEDMPLALLRVDLDGEILEANHTARTLLGVDQTEGLRLNAVMQGMGRSVTEWLASAANDPRASSSEFARLSRKDREIIVHITLTRIKRDGGTGYFAVLNDATELKTLEAQFVQGQKMQAIGQLAGGVAHDFNNLLTAISGHCDLLLLRHDQGDPDYGDLIQIHQNANRAAALVGQLLAFSRKQTLQTELIDLRYTMSDLTHLMNRLVGEKVTLTFDQQPMLPRIRADKRQLEQVMMNLVVNARDAMPDGGNITIKTDELVLKEELHRDNATVPPGKYVRLQVSDEGCGIAPSKLTQIFEPFYTTKRTGEGTGLGLSMVYGIVKQSGGFIFVDSKLDQGTVFTLLMPAQIRSDAPEKPQAPPQVAPSPDGPQSGTVLLVEDEAPVRAFASRALRLRGHSVIEADSAEAAMQLMEDAGLHVDVVVTDVVMPGMDGPTWVRLAREARPNLKVIFVSGYAEDVFNATDGDVPNSVFLPKPFSLQELTETVQAQLG
ncbi:ATP-binding protein [Pseudoprimorskyibacter insulae]|uniref:histidine kinase n=1 Tax=Pseudoprimorskyibacter insulae TaxID=1695997 RepID=A0A2R8AZA1_9RHOB|nr:ATP-binding protein [Pseudoprimorskyibacter insulae]SPF81340.1 Sensor kinase CckA [Pseudoprimorskyibacter insulae]